MTKQKSTKPVKFATKPTTKAKPAKQGPVITPASLGLLQRSFGVSPGDTFSLTTGIVVVLALTKDPQGRERAEVVNTDSLRRTKILTADLVTEYDRVSEGATRKAHRVLCAKLNIQAAKSKAPR